MKCKKMAWNNYHVFMQLKKKSRIWPAWMVMKQLDKKRIITIYFDFSETFSILLLHFDGQDEAIWTCTQSKWKPVFKVLQSAVLTDSQWWVLFPGVTCGSGTV